MLTGRLAFVANSPEELVIAQVQTVPERVSKFVAVPAALDELVARALAKDPDHRYETAAEMAAALRAVTFSVSRTTVPMRTSGAAPALEGLHTIAAPWVVPSPSPAPVHAAAPAQAAPTQSLPQTPAPTPATDGDATWVDPPPAAAVARRAEPASPTSSSGRPSALLTLLGVVAGLLVIVVVLLLLLLLRGA
jgi:serine/threonine-protein kinase